MFHRHAASPPRPTQALDAALRSRGFEIDDFRIEEDTSSALARLLGIVDGILRVRCRSTGEERIYSIGTGSAWLGSFLMDLARGHFADALRSAGSGHLRSSQGLPRQLQA
ncbi:MAG TPA: hypothetical protein VF319_14765 [Caldimonas sp.]